MKEIQIKKTALTPSDLKGAFRKDPTEESVDYIGIIEHALDTPPQGGFAPKDIRDRNQVTRRTYTAGARDNDQHTGKDLWIY